MEQQLRDLADRWRRARRAALSAVVTTAAESDDQSLLAAALAQDPEEAQRRVFENSLRLGASFAKYHDHTLTLDELPSALAEMNAPCLTGQFREVGAETAVILERLGCPAGGSRETCSFWREAIFGLVLGATGGIRHARHESLGHGGRRCVDVFHVDPESPLRFGSIPDDLRPALDRAARLARAFDSTADVRFLGPSEGVLCYRVVRGSGLDVRALVERTIHRSHPEIDLREISPRPVMDDRGPPHPRGTERRP